MSQQNFVFSKYFESRFDEHEPEFVAISQVKEQLLRRGYLVNDIHAQKVLIVSCWAAKANVSKAARIKMQEQIDQMPKQAIIKLGKS